MLSSAPSPAAPEMLQEFRLFAEEILREAGAIARAQYSYELDVDDKAGSPVTSVDKEINALIIKRSRVKYPHIPVLGEEASSKGSSRQLLIVSDPLDGTIPYLLHIPVSTCNMALVVDGEPFVGVVYDFYNDRMYSAVKGRGVYLNGEPMPPAAGPPQMKLVCVERWPAAPYDVSQIQERLNEAGYQSPNYASFGYTSMMICLSKIAGGVYAGDKPWDVAASKVILEELGVKVTNLRGESQRYDRPIEGAIVAYPETHAFLVQ